MATDTTPVKELLEQYREAVTAKENAYSQYKENNAVASEIKGKLLDAMRRDGMKTVKLDDGYSAQRKSGAAITLASPRELEEWFDQNPELEKDAYFQYTANQAMVKTLAKNMLERTGEILPGFDMRNTETLALVKPRDY